jgi:hypothetical protein
MIIAGSRYHLGYASLPGVVFDERRAFWWVVDSGWLIENPFFHPLSTLYYPPKALPALRTLLSDRIVARQIL